MVIHMTVGFVLISASPSHEHDVYARLQGSPDISEIYPLFGEYDMIAKVEARNYDNLSQIVLDKIRNVDGVIDTRTLTGVTL